MLRPCLNSVTATALLGLAATALADTTLHYVTADGGSEQVYEFKDGRMRVNDDQQNTSMIYDRSTDALTMIDHDERQYTVITPGTRQQLQQSVSNAQSQAMQDMRERLAKLPADQRKAIMDKLKQGMHAGGTGLSKAMEVHVDNTGETATVNGHRCEIIVTRIANNRTRACVASAEAVGMPADASATMTALNDAVRQIPGSMMRGIGASLPDTPETRGIPVRMRSDDGPSYTLSELNNESLPANIFQVPKDYDKQDLQFNAEQ